MVPPSNLAFLPFNRKRFCNASNFLIVKYREEISCADAYVLKSLAQKIIANFYIRLNKPKIPTNFFTDEDSAIEWLTTFL